MSSPAFDPYRWHEMHDSWMQVNELEYAIAEAACAGGSMVNDLGLRCGLSGWVLFHRNRSCLLKYGSEDLIRHLSDHPRTTLAAFERGWPYE